MIPQEQLKNLTPLPDQVKRDKMMKSKRHIPTRKLQSRRFRAKGVSRDHVGIGKA